MILRTSSNLCCKRIMLAIWRSASGGDEAGGRCAACAAFEPEADRCGGDRWGLNECPCRGL